jgi:cytochrome c-type biogenesis protein CcmE
VSPRHAAKGNDYVGCIFHRKFWKQVIIVNAIGKIRAMMIAQFDTHLEYFYVVEQK